jgi:large repetitive protein
VVVRLLIRLTSFVAVAMVLGCLALSSPAGAAPSAGGITPTVTVVGSPDPATTGSVDYLVTVTDPTNSGVPTGSVTVSDGTNDATNSCTIENLDVNGDGNCSIEEPAGSLTITADYSGDGSYSPAEDQTTETVNPATPTVAVVLPSGATTGSVSYGVTVSGPAGAVAPSGSVAIFDGTNTCEASLTNGAGSCPLEEGAGNYTITASYPGDPNYNNATGSASGTETVGQATPLVGVTQSGATPGSVTYGVTVSGPAGAVAPTGSVAIFDGTNTCDASLTNGSGSCPLVEGAGPYTISASYPGDPNYTSATWSGTEATVTVSPPSGAKTGSVTYGVSVAGPTGAEVVPTGSVEITDGTTHCTASLTNGSGSCPLIEGAGSYTLTGTYTGDTNYLGTTGPQVNETVAQATATLTPSLASTVSGGYVTYSVTVGGTTPSIVPSGTVTVKDLDPALGPGGTCTITLASGIGNCSFLQYPETAKYTIRFVYSGDPNYLAPAAAIPTQLVTFLPVTVAVTPSPSPAGVGAGQTKVTYNVTVTPTTTSPFPDPTGSVTISDGTGGSCSINNLSSGAGHCRIAESAGSYAVAASYVGDDIYASGTGDVIENVASKTVTAYSDSGSPVPAGQPITLTATVTSKASAAGTPSGSVQFEVGGVDVGAPVTLSDGVANAVYDVPVGAKHKEIVTEVFESSDTDTWLNSTGYGVFKVS